MFAVGVISVRGGCNKCSRGNTWNKQPATDQSDYNISLKYGIIVFIILGTVNWGYSVLFCQLCCVFMHVP